MFDDPDATLSVGENTKSTAVEMAAPFTETQAESDEAWSAVEMSSPFTATQAKAEELDAAQIAEMKRPATVAGPITREGWLIAAVTRLTSLFEANGYKMPPVRVSCGWPSSRGLSTKGRAVGECWEAAAATDGVSQIFVSPFLDQSLVPGEVVATLAHELIHAIIGHDKKHGKEFKKAMVAIGLEGKAKSTTGGPTLVATAIEWEKTIGPYPNASLDALKRPTKKQTTRMIKMTCKDCGYVARTTKKWLDLSGAPLCGCNKCSMEVELPEEADGDDETD
jgi:predicted SprT family Zn-dependent metalloprotease